MVKIKISHGRRPPFSKDCLSSGPFLPPFLRPGPPPWPSGPSGEATGLLFLDFSKIKIKFLIKLIHFWPNNSF